MCQFGRLEGVSGLWCVKLWYKVCEVMVQELEQEPHQRATINTNTSQGSTTTNVGAAHLPCVAILSVKYAPHVRIGTCVLHVPRDYSEVVLRSSGRLHGEILVDGCCLRYELFSVPISGTVLKYTAHK